MSSRPLSRFGLSKFDIGSRSGVFYFWGGRGMQSNSTVQVVEVLRRCTRAHANAIARGRCEGRAGVYRKKLAG